MSNAANAQAQNLINASRVLTRTERVTAPWSNELAAALLRVSDDSIPSDDGSAVTYIGGSPARRSSWAVTLTGRRV